MKPYTTPSYARTQQGSALMVAMVMILMLSIMGITVMRSSTLEYRMVMNAIQTSTTFQAAESASNLALNSVSNLQEAYAAGLEKVFIVVAPPVNTDVGLDSVSALSFVAEVPAVGFSTGIGNNFESLVFAATGISVMEDSGTKSTVEQGAYRIVPSN